MKALFADTYYYLALVNDREKGHDRAVELARTRRSRTLTTAWILTEVGNFLSKGYERRVFLDLVSELQSNPNVTIIPPTQELFRRGIDLFSHRMDKDWSLTDCISFVVMQDHGLEEALTGDGHFEQAGFKVLLD